MPTNECIAFKEHADRVTATATAPVVGKRAVVITGNRQADGTWSCGPAGANARIAGIASWDCATGKKFTVITVEAGDILPVTAGGTIAAGDSVTTDVNGQAVTATAGQKAFGYAIDGATTGNDARIKLARHTA